MTNRKPFLDNLRVLLTALVVFHHAAMIYGARGGWHFREVTNPEAFNLSNTLLSTFCGLNHTYFMGAFFLLAGYFTPAAYDRKGPARFLADRFLRLGVPLLAFYILLGPLTNALVKRVLEGVSIRQSIAAQWKSGAFSPGPLWFLQALLTFSLAYVLWRMVTKATPPDEADAQRPFPGNRALFLSALCVGVGSLALKQIFPLGYWPLGMQLGTFAPYLFFYPAGCLAWRAKWLEKVPAGQARQWLTISAFTVILIPLALWAAKALLPRTVDFNAWAAGIFNGLPEPFIGWGILLALLYAFHRYANRPSRLSSFLTERAYAVYIVHAPVLTAVALALRHLAAPMLVKFVVTGSLTCCACLLVASVLLLLPGAKNIL